MSKILVSPSTVDSIDKLINIGVDGFILGIKDYSIFTEAIFTIDDLKILIPKIKTSNKEIFILINKIIYNKDIPLLKEYLLILDDLNVNGVIYDDVSVVNLKQDLGLKLDLVWGQTHLPTNHNTCDYWLNHGVNYALLSNEITLDEIIEINYNTKIKLMVNIYGYLPMFESSRKLVSNYFDYIKKDNKDKNYYLYEKERNSLYPIYEDINGTYILSPKILNGLEELPKLKDNNIDYVILNSLLINPDNFLKIVSYYINFTNNIEKLSNEVDVLSNNNTDKGFFYKETIYRVKNNG
ncbi:MAG: U32 family peptidase [Bacilli bacterium]|nr:U32 family peptidase [Bacilli bacterium]